MSEKVSNKQVLERVAKEVIQLEKQEEIDGFVNLFLFTVLIA